MGRLHKKYQMAVFILALTLLGVGASISAKPTLSALLADLVPITNNFHENGIVFVVNQGSQASKSTWLTLSCSGTCPDHPGIEAYSHPLFPNSVTIKVPPLTSGQVFKHQLDFWNELSVGPGKAKVLFFVDAGNQTVESNEKNNKKHVTFSAKKVNNYVGLSRKSEKH